MLTYIERSPTVPATASVIWLHGLGADGHNFSDIIPSLQLPINHSIRFLFPHAPMQKVTLNSGMTMRAWYDIFGLNRNAREDKVGLLKSITTINELIGSEHARGIASHRIALVGFSQGGATALATALTSSMPLAGVWVLSGYLAIRSYYTEATLCAPKDLSIHMAHGTRDTVVPHEFGLTSCQHLKTLGYHPIWHSYIMDHEVCSKELQDLSQWLQENLI